jgi:hypothetical protein
MKTATISIRVPEDLKAMIQGICENKGITMTDYCVTSLTPLSQTPPVSAVALQKMDRGGKVEPFEVPDNLTNALSILGGLGVGIIVYNSLKKSLAKNSPEWTEEKIEGISIIAGIGSSILGGVGIHHITKALQGK